jgi:endonuclease YncB( thermonuclease family)
MGIINSTIYTIGTALNRAKEADVSVELLLAGEWLAGMVNAIDGHGVVLLGESGELSIIRMSSIDAVRVRHAAAFDGTPQVEAPQDDLMAWPDAQPMPAGAGDRVGV